MFPVAFLRRPLGRTLLCALAASGLSGCAEQGFSGLGDELDRRKGAFSVVSASDRRAVVSARGKQIAIEPADGFCLANESVEASHRSVFVLIGDCFLRDASSAGRGSRGELSLPRSLPGIMTVSVSGDSVFLEDRAREATLSELSEYLETPKGRAMLGRGAAKNTASVVSTRLIGDGLYVQIEDGEADIVPVLSKRFWRAFVELNERLAVVTISGFRDRPLKDAEMLEHLVDQVKRLRTANRLPVSETPTVVAAAPAPAIVERLTEATDVQSLQDVKPTTVIVTATAGQPPELWPVPPRRVGDAASDDPSDETIGKHAPLHAPTAPRRRRSG